jgi:hypothetical protein
LALTGWLLAGSGLAAAAAPAGQAETVALAPRRVATVAEDRCGPVKPSAPGVPCGGWAGLEVRSQPDLWVVGFENNQELGEKHVLQTVATFDLAPLRALPEGATLAKAALGYGEGRTTRRSASGDSEYGVLPTCNTQLGLPADGWGGGLDRVVPTRPAAVIGTSGVTTGSFGAWDVTPQVKQWLEGAATQGTFVFRSDDESMDVKGQAMCLSYIFDVGLTVEYTPR